jgi:hypothetical protein
MFWIANSVALLAANCSERAELNLDELLRSFVAHEANAVRIRLIATR